MHAAVGRAVVTKHKASLPQSPVTSLGLAWHMQEGKALDAASQAFSLTPAMRAKMAAATIAEEMHAAVFQTVVVEQTFKLQKLLFPCFACAQEGKAHDSASRVFSPTPAMRAKMAATQTAEEMHAAVIAKQTLKLQNVLVTNFASARRSSAQEGKAHDAASQAFSLTPAMRAKMASAQTAEEMHAALGQDCWVVVPISSIAQPGLIMEGSRLTLVRYRACDVTSMHACEGHVQQPDMLCLTMTMPICKPQRHLKQHTWRFSC